MTTPTWKHGDELVQIHANALYWDDRYSAVSENLKHAASSLRWVDGGDGDAEWIASAKRWVAFAGIARLDCGDSGYVPSYVPSYAVVKAYGEAISLEFE